MVLDRGPQFVAELTKKLNKMLGIKTKLSTSFKARYILLKMYIDWMTYLNELELIGILEMLLK